MRVGPNVWKHCLGSGRSFETVRMWVGPKVRTQCLGSGCLSEVVGALVTLRVAKLSLVASVLTPEARRSWEQIAGVAQVDQSGRGP